MSDRVQSSYFPSWSFIVDDQEFTLREGFEPRL